MPGRRSQSIVRLAGVPLHDLGGPNGADANGRGFAVRSSMSYLRFLLSLVLLGEAALVSSPAAADSERVTHVARRPFQDVVTTLQKSVESHKMVLVCEADAQKGAASRGVKIGGNRVLLVFRNDFAVRLLEADPSAGFEAPLRIYVYENADGTATISYRAPSAVFAPYRHPEVRAVAAALDPILKAIVDDALVVGSGLPGAGRGTIPR